MSAKYVQFPLSAVRGIFENHEDAIDRMLCFGIYHYAKKMPCSGGDVQFYLTEDIQTNRIGKAFAEFNLGESFFDVNTLYKRIAHLLNTNEAFKEKAIEYAKVCHALVNLGIKRRPLYILKVAKEVEENMELKEPMPMLNISLLFDFRLHEKSEFDIAQLMAYMGIKSIMGVKTCVKTNKSLVLARMFGYRSKLPPADQQTPLMLKYGKRYHMDRLLEQLELNWRVKLFSNHMRGFFVSTGSKISMDDMVMKAEQAKRKTKVAMLKEKKAAALKRAMQKLELYTDAAQSQHLK